MPQAVIGDVPAQQIRRCSPRDNKLQARNVLIATAGTTMTVSTHVGQPAIPVARRT